MKAEPTSRLKSHNESSLRGYLRITAVTFAVALLLAGCTLTGADSSKGGLTSTPATPIVQLTDEFAATPTTNCIESDEVEKYCLLTNGALIDESHISANASAVLWRGLREAKDLEGDSKIVLTQAAGKDAGYFLGVYTLHGDKLGDLDQEEVIAIGLGLWGDYQDQFELYQCAEFEGGLGSCFRHEDKPSTYLDFILQTRLPLDYDEVQYQQAYEEIVRMLGGGKSVAEKPDYPEVVASKHENHTFAFFLPVTDRDRYDILEFPDELAYSPAPNDGTWTWEAFKVTEHPTRGDYISPRNSLEEYILNAEQANP